MAALRLAFLLVTDNGQEVIKSGHGLTFGAFLSTRVSNSFLLHGEVNLPQNHFELVRNVEQPDRGTFTGVDVDLTINRTLQRLRGALGGDRVQFHQARSE